jgi:hypothetical protein
MKKIPLFKKIKLYREFKKQIDVSKNDLLKLFNTRVDDSYRLYTVLNIPEQVIGEAFTIKKSDIDKISENFIREFTFELSKYLDSNNLKELYEIYEVKKVDKYSYLIVVGFSLFKSNKYYENINYKLIPSVIVLTILLLIYLFK